MCLGCQRKLPEDNNCSKMLRSPKNGLDSVVLSSGLLGALQADGKSREIKCLLNLLECVLISPHPSHTPSGFRTPLFTYCLFIFEAGFHYVAMTALEFAM